MEPQGSQTQQEISNSRFYMWRAVFAMAHADHVVTKEENEFMQEVLAREPFSIAQKGILELDIKKGQNIGDMFMEISDQKDRSKFFYYARMLCWCDGDFDEQEQQLMIKLNSFHVRNVDFGDMIETVELELDDEQKEMMAEDMRCTSNPLMNFFQRFSSI